MNYTPEQMREYNIKAAELLCIYDYTGNTAVMAVFEYETTPREFNFFTNAADKDMLLEKLEIDTFYFRDGEFWRCDNIDSGGDGEVRNKSMTTTQIACIVSCLDCDNR